METFSEVEFAGLERMRRRYQAGEWRSPRDGCSLVERLGIEMTARALGVGHGGAIHYACHLRRTNAEGVFSLSARFQVLPINPAPPDTEEVLRWLAGCVATATHTADLSHWGMLCGITPEGRVATRPYRGLVHEAPNLEEFASSLKRRAIALRSFLGEPAFAELMQEVGVS